MLSEAVKEHNDQAQRHGELTDPATSADR